MEDAHAESRETYEEFKERVKRTVYVDNLSPQVTETILRAAFDQFVEVASIQFIPNYLGPDGLPCAALVELKTEQAATSLVNGVAKSPLMVCGMPRPVRARLAEEEMFEDRPRDPSRRITIQWLDKEDPKFEACRKQKVTVRKHTAEARRLLEHELERDEKLANQQEEHLKTIFRKYDLITGVLTDGSAKRLAQRYNMPNLAD